MKWNKWIAFPMILLLVFSIGCGRDKVGYLETAEWDTAAGEEASEPSTEISVKAVTGDSAADSTQETKETAAADGAETVNGQLCYVYVCGAVGKPGVYVLSSDARIYEAIELAGGLLEDASGESVNQAEPVTDGMMVRIPTKEEALQEPPADVLVQSSSDISKQDNASADGSSTDDGRINLNTADASDLMTLPGIGRSKADSIIAYREENGQFSSVESIMNVDGIKEGVYNRIRDRIKVN